MVTAVAVRPLSITLPLVAPLSSFTVIFPVPEALEPGAGNICAGAMATAITAMLDTVMVIAGVVAVSLALSVTLAVSIWLPMVTVVLFQLTV